MAIMYKIGAGDYIPAPYVPPPTPLEDQQARNRSSLVNIGQNTLDSTAGLSSLGNLFANQGQNLYGLRLGAAQYDPNVQMPSLNDTQRGDITNLANEAINAGFGDIDAGTQRGLQLLRQELAPSRGLRPGDTPILDRGGDIVNEANRLKQQLASGVRLGQFQNFLDLPFRLGEFNLNRGQLGLEANRQRAEQLGGLQNTGLAITDFLQQLQQRDFQNRFSQEQLAAQIGLGLAGIGPGPVPSAAIMPAGNQSGFASSLGGSLGRGFGGAIGEFLGL